MAEDSKRMKITKNRLKQLIKEELENFNEGEFDGVDPVIDPVQDVFDKVMQMYRFLVGRGVDPERVKKMIRDQTEFALSRADWHPMNKSVHGDQGE